MIGKKILSESLELNWKWIPDRSNNIDKYYEYDEIRNLCKRNQVWSESERLDI